MIKKGELLEKALVLMVNSHSGQFDKGGNPYQLHPLACLMMLQNEDEEIQCVALLHDVPEDCNVSFQHLLDVGFSERIVNAVKLLTKQNGQTHEEYLEGILSNKDAMIVKQADLRHNSDLTRLKGM